MPFIVTPRQLSHRAEFYHQLGSLTEAGIGLPQALEQLHRKPPTSGLRQEIHELSRHLAEGYTFAESLHRASRWLPSFDTSLLEAGEQSGRLDAAFKLLAGYYRERAQLVRTTIASLGYPVFILHIALLIFPMSYLTGLLQAGGDVRFVVQKIAVLVPSYVLVVVLIFACQGRHGETWRALMEQVFRFVPLLGSARRQLALARLAASLEALISAGVSIVTSWELAATASGSPALRRAVLAWKSRIEAGQTPAEVLGVTPEFPEMFANLYSSGEISGKLEDTLHRLHHHYQEEGTRKLSAFAKWSAQAVYLAIMLGIAWQVISFWMGYFDQINEVIK